MYAALLADSQVRRLLCGSLIARLPTAMLPLSILLLVVQSGGSIGAAGLVVGAYGAGRAAGSPVVGALVDRHGMMRVLVADAVAQALALSLVVMSAGLHLPLLATGALAIVAGAASPPVQACMRALWPVVVDEKQRDAAYSFDATSQELLWITGPLLVAAILGAGTAALAIAIGAVVTAAGVAVFVTSPVARAARGSLDGRRFALHALSAPGIRVLIGVSVCTGLAWGAVTVGLSALAVASGAPRASGVLLAALSLGSITGGLAYGAFGWRRAALGRLRTLLAGDAVLSAPLMLVRSVAPAVPLTVLAGLFMAPTYAASYVLTGSAAPKRATTEAFTWTSSAFGLGVALGTSAGGLGAQSIGVWSAFALATAAPLLADLLTWLPGRSALSGAGGPTVATAPPPPLASG